MARIRSIKPDFWTSEQVLNLSRDARLFFIGLWNFASDYGCHPNQPKNLKVKIFPADDDVSVANVRGYIAELSANGLIAFFDLEDAEYINILGWSAHQRVDKPRKGDVKAPAYIKKAREASPNIPGAVAEASRRKDGGMEGGMDTSPHSTTTSDATPGSGCAVASPDRPTADNDPELVTVVIPSGAKLTIDRLGNYDEVWAPMDCPPTKLSRPQLLDLRAKAIAERKRDGPSVAA